MVPALASSLIFAALLKECGCSKRKPSLSSLRGMTWRRYFWWIYLESKEIDTNHRGRGRHFFFKVIIFYSCRMEQYKSFSERKHLKMTNKHLRSAMVIMNMENTVKPISWQRLDKFSWQHPLHALLRERIAFSLLIWSSSEPAWAKYTQ